MLVISLQPCIEHVNFCDLKGVQTMRTIDDAIEMNPL
jgi:hypothetical protein